MGNIPRFGSQRPQKVERALDYDAAFCRHSGWTGADGGYSVELSDGRCVWLFSDTLLGSVDESLRRILDERVPVNSSGYPIINNSIAVQDRGEAKSIRFIIGNHHGVPESLFRPRETDGWFWINDAVNNGDGSITVLLNKFVMSNEKRFALGEQVALWTADLRVDNDVTIDNYRRITAVDAADEDGHETVWGAGLLVEGGWTYIYGGQLPPANCEQTRRLVIARVAHGHIRDSDAWRFFDGQKFVADGRLAVTLPVIVSNEISINKLPGCGYLLILASVWGLGPVSLSFADSPTGPWSEPREVWHPPENDGAVYSYNPKAHPGRSDDRGLLISYNVNSVDVEEALLNADVCHPRFIRVPWNLIELMYRESR